VTDRVLLNVGESLFADVRWTTGPIYKSFLSREPRAPKAAALRTFIDRTGRRGDNNGPLYDAARVIESLEIGE
jgi:hypothetical protein